MTTRQPIWEADDAANNMSYLEKKIIIKGLSICLLQTELYHKKVNKYINKLLNIAAGSN